MQNHPVVSVKHGLSAMALAALAVLAACGGEPARLEVVAEFKLEENARLVQKLVSKYTGHKLVLGKAGDRHTLRAPAPLAAELQPGLDRLITRLALDESGAPTPPSPGRPAEQRDYERQVDERDLEKEVLTFLGTRGIEPLAVHVTLAQKRRRGAAYSDYEHVGAILVLPGAATPELEAEVVRRLGTSVATEDKAPTVDIQLLDVRACLRPDVTPPKSEVVDPAPAPMVEPLTPMQASATPESVAPEMASPVASPTPPTASAVEVTEASPTPPNACPARPAPAAETAPAPVVQPPLEAKPHAPAQPASAEEARADAPADEPPTEPMATNEVPPAEPSHGAMWILYLVAMASLCGNVACVLVWWRARRRERERARLARLFAKVA